MTLRLLFGSLQRNIPKKIPLCNNLRAMSKMAPSGVALSDIIQKLESFAPLRLSEKWDNTGLLVEPFTPKPIRNVLLTNDLTEDVMQEAVDSGTNLIVSYHPPIFSGLKRITQNAWKERIASRCLERGIAVYSPHTSWDAVEGGVNDWLASCLPPHARTVAVEGASPGCAGQGRLCRLNEPRPLGELIEAIKSHVGNEKVMLAKARGLESPFNIGTVALCAGSGSSVLRGVKADLYLTGEMSHHDVLDAVHCGSSVILTNHSNSERGFLKTFAGELEKMMDNRVSVKTSVKDCDPLIFI